MCLSLPHGRVQERSGCWELTQTCEQEMAQPSEGTVAEPPSANTSRTLKSQHNTYLAKCFHHFRNIYEKNMTRQIPEAYEK